MPKEDEEGAKRRRRRCQREITKITPDVKKQVPCEMMATP